MTLKKIVQMERQRKSLIVTPTIHDWLISHPEGVVVPSKHLERIIQVVTALPRDRSAGFSPSQLYQCHRRQMFQFIGVPQRPGGIDSRLQNLFNDGTWRHIRWQVMGLNAGLFNVIEHTFKLPDLRFQGSLDGAGVSANHNDREYVFELKGTSQFRQVVGNRAPMPEHVLQVYGYFIGTGIDLAAIVYEDKQTQEWKEFVIERDDTTYDKLKDTLISLNQQVDQRVLPGVRNDCKAQSGTTFQYCPYNHICLGCKDWDQAEELAGVQAGADQSVQGGGQAPRSTRNAGRTVVIRRRSPRKGRAAD